MGTRFAELYASRAQPGGVVGASQWDAIFQDLDLRIGAAEEFIPRLDAVITGTEALALARLNETLAPAIGRIQLATEFGFLVAASATPAELAPGNILTFVLTEGAQRDLFQPSAFVNLTRQAGADDYAVARVLGFARAQGELRVEVIQNWGDPGPFDDWQISVAAGVVTAVVQMLDDVRSLRTLVAGQVAAMQLVADRFEAAVEAIEAGPVTSVNGQIGVIAGLATSEEVARVAYETARYFGN